MKSNIGWVALAIAMQAQNAFAEGDLLGADQMAEAIVSMTSRVWTGPRTPSPIPTDRPLEGGLALRSTRALLAIHAEPRVSHDTLRRAMRALEHARARLDALGWPQPLSDGDLGGGPELDLYLTGSLPSGAYTDGLVPWTYLDRASVFVVLSPAIPSALLDACVTEAYVEALLLSADPAEAETWRRATSAWLAWELTGRFGCHDPIHEQQAEPSRSWIDGAAEHGAGGAMWLAYLSARHDGSGDFVRDLWALASQRTWEGDGLRADPDLWSATQTAIELGGDRLLDNVEELAVLRWFIGRGETRDSALAGIDGDARVPVTRRMTRIPTRVSSRLPLDAFGSAYVVMNAAAWEGAARLHAWLRGEYGVRWSFVAIQLDARGDEVRRIAAPHTAVEPHAFLPIELAEEATELLFVVTNLSNGVPDADEPSAEERGFQIIVDRAN